VSLRRGGWYFALNHAGRWVWTENHRKVGTEADCRRMCSALIPGLFHTASEIAELFFPHPGFSLVAIHPNLLQRSPHRSPMWLSFPLLMAMCLLGVPKMRLDSKTPIDPIRHPPPHLIPTPACVRGEIRIHVVSSKRRVKTSRDRSQVASAHDILSNLLKAVI
jgi:hypothetical protein